MYLTRRSLWVTEHRDPLAADVEVDPELAVACISRLNKLQTAHENIRVGIYSSWLQESKCNLNLLWSEFVETNERRFDLLLQISRSRLKHRSSFRQTCFKVSLKLLSYRVVGRSSALNTFNLESEEHTFEKENSK